MNTYLYKKTYSWDLWWIWIENSSVFVIFHGIFVVFLPDLLSSRLYFLPQTWPAQCDCELKSSGILDTHLYSIYCSTKIYDFSSKAAWPFWRQREKPICLGSPESPDVKSSSSAQRSLCLFSPIRNPLENSPKQKNSGVGVFLSY